MSNRTLKVHCGEDGDDSLIVRDTASSDTDVMLTMEGSSVYLDVDGAAQVVIELNFLCGQERLERAIAHRMGVAP